MDGQSALSASWLRDVAVQRRYLLGTFQGPVVQHRAWEFMLISFSRAPQMKAARLVALSLQSKWSRVVWLHCVQSWDGTATLSLISVL